MNRENQRPLMYCNILPFYLRDSAATIAVIFNKTCEIKYRNDLFAASLRTNRHSKGNMITDFFDNREVVAFKKLLHELTNDKSKSLKEFISHDKNFYYCWEFSIHEDAAEELIIGIAHKEQSIEKKVQISLLESEELFHSFINNSPAISWITDETGKMLLMNNRFKELVGLTDDDIGKTLWEIYPKELADTYHENNRKALEENKVVYLEEVSVDKTGNMRHFIVYKFPVKKRGNKKLIGGWSIDRTEHKRIENKLVEHNVRLKQIAFLQSHEIRRPVANILGITELMNLYKEDGGYEKALELLDHLKESTIELDELIKKIVKKASKI